MKLFDPHIHMTSRTTDDYQAMAAAGIRGIIEPAFWLGQPRTSVGTFQDYFASLIGWERFRASQFGVKHYCTIALNPKEANNPKIAEGVIDTVVGVLLHETLRCCCKQRLGVSDGKAQIEGALDLHGEVLDGR